MRRFSILNLMGLVLISGVGIAALSASTDLWDSVVFSATLLILATSTLLALRQPPWLGFALFGWVYLVASLIPWVESRLLTTRAIAYLDAKTAHRQWYPRTLAFSHQGDLVLGDEEDAVRIWDSETGRPLRPTGTFVSFRRIGHSLFTLLFGLLGMVIAGWMWRDAQDLKRENIRVR